VDNLWGGTAANTSCRNCMRCVSRQHVRVVTQDVCEIHKYAMLCLKYTRLRQEIKEEQKKEKREADRESVAQDSHNLADAASECSCECGEMTVPLGFMPCGAAACSSAKAECDNRGVRIQNSQPQSVSNSDCECGEMTTLATA
jgi:hypothetical protein